MGDMSGVDWLPSYVQSTLPHNPLGPFPCTGYENKHYPMPSSVAVSVENKHEALSRGTTNKSKDGKPPYSYASLIRLAISNCPKGKMTLSEIYQFIIQTFPYYKDAGPGWKNSIRHNLSLNKCFTKVARSKDDPGKGSYWAIDYNFSQDEAFIKKKKGHMFRSSPYSPECSSNSSDYSAGQNTRAINHSIPETVIPQTTPILLSDSLDTGDALELPEEETVVTERCAGPRHQCYTDEYGNYIDQYNEECDHTCLPYAAVDPSIQSQHNYYINGDYRITENGVYGSYSSSSDLCSPLYADSKFFDFQPQYSNEEYTYDQYNQYNELNYNPALESFPYRTEYDPNPMDGAIPAKKLAFEGNEPVVWNDCL